MYVGHGRCACAGITMGKVLHIKTPEVADSVRTSKTVEEELNLFESALLKAQAELDSLQTSVTISAHASSKVASMPLTPLLPLAASKRKSLSN